MFLKSSLIFAITMTVVVNDIYCDFRHYTLKNTTYIQACGNDLTDFIVDFCNTSFANKQDSNRQTRDVFTRDFNENPNYVSRISSHSSPTLKKMTIKPTSTLKKVRKAYGQVWLTIGHRIQRSTGVANECCMKYCSMRLVVSICRLLRTN